MSNPFQVQPAGLVGVNGVPLPAAPAKPKPQPKAKPKSEWQRAIDAQRQAMQTGSQLPAGPSQRVADDGLFRGPAYPGQGSAQNMSLYDWQDMTGIYDAAPDSKNDAWTPTGYGVPGVPRELESGYGLIDAYGRGVYGEDGKVQKPGATTEGRTNQRTTTNPNGVTQTMTNTGAINMPGLADVDMTGIANFAGPSFPTQQDTNKINDSFIATKTKFLTEPKNKDGSAFEVPGATGESTNMAITGNTFRPQTYASGAAGDIGGLDGFKPGGKFSGAPTATEGQRSYRPADPSGEGIGGFGDEDMAITGPDPAAYATSNEEMRRRSTFLDSSGDSLKAMDNVAKGMGMGRGFANVDGEAVAMRSSDRRKILQAAPGEAQALKDKWVKAIANNKADEPQTASSAQNPTQPSGTATFGEDMKQDIASAGQAVDFLNDNQETSSVSKPKVKFESDKFNMNSGLGGSLEDYGMSLLNN